MTTIRITEFKGYSEASFLDYLNLYSKSFYEIIIPKELELKKDGPMFIQDFYNAVYVGQLLSRISDDVLCTLPEPFVKGEFSFIVLTTELEKLASLLYYFSTAFDFKDNEEAYIDFQCAASDINNLLKEGEEFACPTYVHFIDQYLEENDL